MNARIRHSKTGLRGVRKVNGTNLFMAEITKEQKHHYLGCFASPQQAAEAYNKKSIELFGEFAVLNQI